MAFDTSSKDRFSSLPNALMENPIKPHLRNVFSFGGSPNGNTRFNNEGSSMNASSGRQIPPWNWCESLHHHNSGYTSTSGAMGASSLADTGATGEAHELQSKELMNFSQGMNQILGTTIFGESGNTRLAVDGYEKKRKVKWTPQEDCLLRQTVPLYEETQWSKIAEHIPGRNEKQCWHRWRNSLRPDIKTGRWTAEEEIIFVEAHKKLGNKWAEIAKRLSRADNDIKNHWKATIRKCSSAPSCKGPKSLLNYVKDLVSSSAANVYLEPNISVLNAINNQQAQQQGSSSQYWADERLAPTRYNGAVDACRYGYFDAGWDEYGGGLETIAKLNL